MAVEIIEVPLVGKILKVNVNPGDKVKEGDEICIIESMKMENSILTPASGTVKEVKVTPGQVVKAGEIIGIIEY